jgi:hypothetical protein
MPDERAKIETFITAIASNEISELPTLITEAEIDALRKRCEDLLARNSFPEPNPNWPHIPWPPF